MTTYQHDVLRKRLIDLWIDEQCTLGPEFRCTLIRLYSNYYDWCLFDRKDGPMGKNNFARRLEQLGYFRKPNPWFRGLMVDGPTPKQFPGELF